MSSRERVFVGIILLLVIIIIFGAGYLLGKQPKVADAPPIPPSSDESEPPPSGESLSETPTEESVSVSGSARDIPTPTPTPTSAPDATATSTVAARSGDDNSSAATATDTNTQQASSSASTATSTTQAPPPPNQATNTPAPPTKTLAPGQPTATSTDTPTATLTPTLTPTDSGPTPIPSSTPINLNLPDDPFDRINYYRAIAGLSLISEDTAMSIGAMNHAIYMGANKEALYYENTSNDYYTSEGAQTAPLSSIWLGNGTGLWNEADPIEKWMTSPYNRIWLLYPKATNFGYGFTEEASTNHSAATLQIFGGWDDTISFIDPVEYPASGQTHIPSTRFGVSLQFPTETNELTFSFVEWLDEDGNKVNHYQYAPETDSYMRDYGKAIFLLPNSNLPPWTSFHVHIIGVRDGQPFDIQWSFTTGD